MTAQRILVDATAIPTDRGGVGRYVDEVVAGMAARGADLVVACHADDEELFSRLAPAARLHALPAAARRRPVRMAWEQTGLPRVARRTRSAVLWSPHYTSPVRAGVPTVVTLHDATFFSDPAVHQRSKTRFFRAATRTAVRTAAACVVPSAATRDEVARWTGADPGVMRVVPHGVDLERFRPQDPSTVSDLASRLGLGSRPYVAFLGTLEPRKNVSALVEGWVRAARDLPDPPALVLAGGRGWDARLDAAVAAVPAHLMLVRTGYLPYDDLPTLLSGAVVVAYPSLGEGFGLPVLEAMACGAAVLTTRCLALPEVGGDAVAYCGTDAASIGAELGRLLSSPEERGRLGRLARGRASTFTWERSASAHLALLHEVVPR